MHSNGRELPHLFRVRNPLPDCKLKLHPVVVKKGGVQTSDEVPLYGAAFTNPLGRIVAKPWMWSALSSWRVWSGGASGMNPPGKGAAICQSKRRSRRSLVGGRIAIT